MDSHVLTAVIVDEGVQETEPVVAQNRGHEVVLTLDDGRMVYLDTVELRSVLDAPVRLAEAA